MRAIFKSVWVRKLIGKLGVPYNRRLGVRDSSHPLFYDADLSLHAAESNAFRIQSVLFVPAFRIASLIASPSSGEKRACIKTPLYLAFGTFGLPILVFINSFSFCMTQIIVDKSYNL
jgi:nitrate reductase NapE component